VTHVRLGTERFSTLALFSGAGARRRENPFVLD